MRPVIIAANWKMHTTPAEAGELARTIAARMREPSVTRVICPPFVCLAAVRDALGAAGEDVAVGAQNVHHELYGAYTGEVSAPMLEGLATWVIIGHSERRQYFGETDDTVNKKLKVALDAGVTPIVCVGEVLEEREAGITDDVLRRQCNIGFRGISGERAARLVVAYEPVWAIGTGKVASPEQAQEIHHLIREVLREMHPGSKKGAKGGPRGTSVAEKVRILYGGSVKPANAKEILQQPDIDGVLVGGASLDPRAFGEIVKAAL